MQGDVLGSEYKCIPCVCVCVFVFVLHVYMFVPSVALLLLTLFGEPSLPPSLPPQEQSGWTLKIPLSSPRPNC